MGRAIKGARIFPAGAAAAERRLAEEEAVRAFAEIHDRGTLCDLAAVAHRGPLDLARRIRSTEFGSHDAAAAMSDWSFWELLYGEGARLTDPYVTSYVAAFQTALPYLERVH